MSDTISFTQSRRVTALVDLTIEYEVSKDTIDKLVASGMEIDEALEYSISTLDATSTSYNAEVDEVVMEHNSCVEID